MAPILQNRKRSLSAQGLLCPLESTEDLSDDLADELTALATGGGEVGLPEFAVLC